MLILGTSQAQIFLGNRDLQATTNTTSSNSTSNGTSTNGTTSNQTVAVTYTSTTKSLNYYGSNLTVPFTAKLGCGACINSGYTFCVQGKAW